MEWNNDVVLEFIKLLEGEPCIWNSKSNLHKNKNFVNDAWTRISRSMTVPCTIEELKKKRNSLLTQYRECLKKIKDSTLTGSGAEEIYRPSWFAFDAIHSYMGPLYDCQQTISTQIQESHIKFEKVGKNFETEVIVIGADTETASHTNSNSSVVKNGNISKNPRKRIIKEYNNLLTKVQNVANTINKPLQSENEFDIFGKSIAAQLKNMPLDMAIEAQMFIQNYLSEMRLKAIRHTTCS